MNTRWLYCKIQRWQPREGQLPPIGATITDGMLHQPVKAFKTKEEAQAYAETDILNDSQYFIPDIIEIKIDEAGHKIRV